MSGSANSLSDDEGETGLGQRAFQDDESEPVNITNHGEASLPATLECDDPVSQDALTLDHLLANLRARTDSRGYAAKPIRDIKLSELRAMRLSHNIRAALALLKEKRHLTIDDRFKMLGGHKVAYWTIPEVRSLYVVTDDLLCAAEPASERSVWTTSLVSLLPSVSTQAFPTSTLTRCGTTRPGRSPSSRPAVTGSTAATGR